MAQNLKIRSERMISLRRYIEDEGLEQKKAAELSGVQQPRISDLMRGKIANLRLIYWCGLEKSSHRKPRKNRENGFSFSVTRKDCARSVLTPKHSE